MCCGGYYQQAMKKKKKKKSGSGVFFVPATVKGIIFLLLLVNIKLEHGVCLGAEPPKRKCTIKQIYLRAEAPQLLPADCSTKPKDIGKVIQHHRGQSINYQASYRILTHIWTGGIKAQRKEFYHLSAYVKVHKRAWAGL
jgi:hypothetical protein